MLMKCLHLFCGLLLLALVAAQSKLTSYKLTFEREKLFSECDSNPEDFITKMFDISELTFTLLDDNNIHLKGPLKTIMDTSQMKNVQVQAQVFKKSRSQWVDTMYNAKKADFCQALYDPKEFWYSQTSKVPEDQRVCPPPKDYVINLDMIIDTVLKDFDKGQSEGDYKIQFTLIYGPKPNDVLCFLAYLNASKM